MKMYCGDECTSVSDTYDERATFWGTTPKVEMKIKSMEESIKMWLIDHWVYANNFYKINLIIILLDDLYKKKKDEEIVSVAIDFLLYNTCSGLISFAKQQIAKNFENIARSLRENPRISEYLTKIKHSTENRADDLCVEANYATDYGKAYNGGDSILHKFYSTHL
jgi:hypothetical protein